MTRETETPDEFAGLLWASVLERIDAWPDDAPEWDRLEAAVARIRATAAQKIGARLRLADSLAAAVSALAEALGHDAAYFGAPDLADLTSSTCPPGTTREVLSAAEACRASVRRRAEHSARKPSNVRDAKPWREELTAIEDEIAEHLGRVAVALRRDHDPMTAAASGPTAERGDAETTSLPDEGGHEADDALTPVPTAEAHPTGVSAADEADETDPPEDDPGFDRPTILPVVEGTDAAAPRETGSNASPSDAATVPVDTPETPTAFAEFRARHVVDAHGAVVAAPWTRADFGERVERAARRAFEERRLRDLWVFAAAAEQTGSEPLVDPRDVEAWSAVVATPANVLAGVDPGRTERMLEWLTRGANARTRLALALALEGVRPSIVRPLSDAEVDALLQAVEFDDPDVVDLLKALVRFGGRGADLLGALRDALGRGEAEARGGDPSRRLAEARDDFHREVLTLWSGAGGRIQRTHCRRAWDDFVSEYVAPLHDALRPKEGSDDPGAWDLAAMAGDARDLERRHAEIADRAGAMMLDRRLMDRAATRLAERASAVIEAARRAHVVPALGRDTTAYVAAARRVTDAAVRSARSELDACRSLVAVALGVLAPEDVGSLRFGEADVLARPALLELLSPQTEGAATWKDGVAVSSVSDARAAAAVLLEEAIPPADAAGDAAGIVRSTLGLLLERDRFDLAAYLVADPSIEASQKAALHRRVDDYVEETRRDFDRLEGVVADLDALSSHRARDLRRLLDDVRRRLADGGAASRDARLFRAWIGGALAYAEGLLASVIEGVRSDAARLDAGAAARVDALVAERRFSEALDVLYARETVPRAYRVRETLWRDEAAKRWPQPRATLGAGKEPLGRGHALAQKWIACPRDHEPQRSLRRAFFDFVDGDRQGQTKARAAESSQALRTIETNVIRVHAHALRALIVDEVPRPSFLRQLRDVADVVLISLYASAVKSQELAKEAIRRVNDARRTAHDVVVLLTPSLPPLARDEILRQLRATELRAAVVDDLDLCRLVAPGDHSPHGYTGLLEIVLEQLRWSGKTNPYDVSEGRNTGLDVFVGRRSDAETLQTTSGYTRIFSGRGLGKSALLRFVELAYDGKPLPSGNALRVASIVAAGGEDEAWVVDAVVAAVRAKTGFDPGALDAPNAGDRLAEFTRRYVEERPDESLLVVIDEADTFIERQFEEYERTAERCLSFRMIKELNEAKDSAGLPRVRFLFAGYRVTHRNRAAFANGGEVLRLGALDEADAIRLVEGPLARLGVDASEQAASVARRCGFQPAVLLKFGSELLDHLRARHLKTGDRVPVRPADVVATYNTEAVQQAVRRLVFNNFESNDTGAAVFCALLLVLADLTYGASVTQPTDQILERLGTLAGDLSWLARDNQSARREVEQQLRDFVARGLLTEVETPEGHRGYRLTYPHQLGTLLAEDLPALVVQRIGRTRHASVSQSSPAGLLPRRVLDDMVDMRSSAGRELGCEAVVVAGHWSEALEDDRAGVAARLGYREADVARGFDEDKSVAIEVDPAAAGAFLDREKKSDVRLLVGGIDLLRWAVAEEPVRTVFYGLGRLDAARILWWFAVRRTLEFETPGAEERVATLTGGVPLLVREFDRALDVADGATVDRARFIAAEAAFASRLETAARDLAEGPPAVRLSPREGEILALVAEASELGHDIDLGADLGPSGLFGDGARGARPDPFGTRREDRMVARILGVSGILDVDEQLVVRLAGPNDPAIRLAAPFVARSRR